MIDMYMTEGHFPTTFPNKDHHFEGPVRAHYRPRRPWTALIILFSGWMIMPSVFGALLSLFCSGVINLMIGAFLVALGMCNTVTDVVVF